MVTLTAFADEISPDLHEQLDVLASEEIRHLEFRGVWHKNVLMLSDEELRAVKQALDERGMRVSSIGSPVGKIQITDDFAPHRAAFARALEVARYFEAPFIRIFSFFIPKGHHPDEYRDEVLRRLEEIAAMAEGTGITLVHENEKEIYGDTGERCRDLLNVLAPKGLRAAFDPANFVQCGVKPFTDAYPLLKEYVAYVHIKDALFDGGRVVPAGEGDGEVKPLLLALQQAGYNGFLSLEPHLASAGRFQGFSGAELFRVASRALKRLLDEIGEPWQ